MLKYTTVLFDLDGTLLDFEKAEKTAFFQAMNRHGLTPTDELHREYSAINASLWKRFERGEMEKPDIGKTRYRTLLERNKITADGVACNETYCSLLAQQGFTLDGAEETCKKLTEMGVKLYAITNGAEHIQKTRFALSGLEKYFECSFTSERVGFQKPDIRYFSFVLANVDERDKSRIIVVGDSPTSDILGGNNAELDTCCVGNDSVEGIVPTYTIEKVGDIFTVICE